MDPLEMLERALSVLRARAVTVEPRFAQYEGRHTTVISSESWSRTYQRQVSSLIENQSAKVIDEHVRAISPEAVLFDEEDALAELQAAYATRWIEEHLDVWEQAATFAEVSGVTCGVIVTPDSFGTVQAYAHDPRKLYVERDGAGRVLWAVLIWAPSDLSTTEATVLTPTETVVYATTTTKSLPNLDEFREAERTPNTLGRVPVAAVDKRSSLIDRVKPINDLLNLCHQKAHVAGEAYVLPFVAFLGLDTYDERTSTRREDVPNLNPASGSRQLVLPSSVDADGNPVNIIQLAGQSPAVFQAEAEGHRLTIASLGSIPGFILQHGSGQPQTAEALEIAYLGYTSLANRNIRHHYRPFARDLAALVIQTEALLRGSVVVPSPTLDVKFSELSTTTRASQFEAFRVAREGGVPLVDALQQCLGFSVELAEQIAANAAEEAGAAAQRAGSVFDAGADLLELS